jgi:hypothetical protein
MNYRSAMQDHPLGWILPRFHRFEKQNADFSPYRTGQGSAKVTLWWLRCVKERFS